MAVRDFIINSWGSDIADRFPGPQPVSIERRHFPLLKKQPYVVCEKTDGVRHLLVSNEEGVFLVNRAFKIDPVKVRIPKGTILDGELVTAKNGKVFFMVYDAVIVKGESVSNFDLKLRLEKAKSVIKGIIKTSQAPFEVRLKTMWPLGDPIPDLNSFEYETDGLVFTPVNEPIRTGTHETMFKWKPQERITIDFELKLGKDLFVQDRGTPYKEAELHLQNKRGDLPNGTIVECGYGDLGFYVEKVRTDKTHANNRRTYFRTLINLKEAIQLSEFTGL
jgi:hypothetical protein